MFIYIYIVLRSSKVECFPQTEAEAGKGCGKFHPVCKFDLIAINISFYGTPWNMRGYSDGETKLASYFVLIFYFWKICISQRHEKLKLLKKNSKSWELEVWGKEKNVRLENRSKLV